MECKIMFYIILLGYSSAALPTIDISHHTPDHYENLNENSQFVDEISKKPETNIKPYAKYEVTEIIQDIPDDRTVGPIHTNFTKQRPLNIASTKRPLELEEKYSEIEKNLPSSEEDDDQDLDSQEDPNIIKGYFADIKKGFVKGFKNIVHLHSEEALNDEDEPFSILKKIHTKTAHVAQKVSKALFGNFDDVFGL